MATTRTGRDLMPIFNVRAAVVALVEAASADEALRAFRGRLTASGFEPYMDEGDAFESEDGAVADMGG